MIDTVTVAASGGLVARLRNPLAQRADFGDVLAGAWQALTPAELAARLVYLERDGVVPLGELFEVSGAPDGRLRLAGDLTLADRVGAGLQAGEVVVEGNVGREAGLAMAGGTLVIRGDAGPRAGAAVAGHRRGMTGGELIIHGSAGPEAGAVMRRGLIVIGRDAGERAGVGMIAGTVVIFGAAGPGAGQWSKRGSVVALGSVTPSPTYRYACTYQPPHLRLTLARLGARFGLPVTPAHLAGDYDRFSGDFAELGKGEILAWRQG